MSEIIFYRSEDGNTEIDVFGRRNTLDESKVNSGSVGNNYPECRYSFKKIYDIGELSEEGTCKFFLQVQNEGEREIRREVKFYNLDAVISVGYRVNSRRATDFRKWATAVLQEYVIKGFVMDDERLKNGKTLGKDYFDELLARIREIRASERIFYRKVTDIYATSKDYDPRADISQEFFAEVQNKFLFAVSEKTAPELIFSRANANEKNMGLQTWKGQKTGQKIVETDVVVGKNYLNEKEITELNLLVSGYLDYTELQANKGNVMYMKDWIEKTKNFLNFNEMKVLEGKGKISKSQADKKAKEEFEKFRIQQDREYISDFDKFTQKVLRR